MSLPENFYPLYLIFSSIVVTNLITTECPAVIELLEKLPSNSTVDDIHAVYHTAINSESSYERNCITLWWKALVLFCIMGAIIRSCPESLYQCTYMRKTKPKPHLKTAYN